MSNLAHQKTVVADKLSKILCLHGRSAMQIWGTPGMCGAATILKVPINLEKSRFRNLVGTWIRRSD